MGEREKPPHICLVETANDPYARAFYRYRDAFHRACQEPCVRNFRECVEAADTFLAIAASEPLAADGE